MIASMWVFQKGAILGRAKSDRIKRLAKLVALEGGEENMFVIRGDQTKC